MMKAFRNPISTTFVALFFLLSNNFCWGQANEDVSSGAIIILSAKGLVQVLDPSGNVVPGTIKPGAVLAEGFSIKTGFSGESSMLFSNGTVASIEPRSEVKIATFLQKAFEAGNQKVSDLETEPSSSQLTIDIGSGSLVVQTKKLDRSSSFTINSPAGTAGIRGTEFQMGLNPAGDAKLDVASSVVAFTPPGGDSIVVSQGKGLDVSANGAVNQRPIDPVISLNISAKNTLATSIAAAVPLATVNQAKEKASALSAVSEGKESKSSESSSDDDESEEEEDSDGEKKDARESAIEQGGINTRSVPGTQTGSAFKEYLKDLADGNEMSPPNVAVPDAPIGEPSSQPPSSTGLITQVFYSVQNGKIVLSFQDANGNEIRGTNLSINSDPEFSVLYDQFSELAQFSDSKKNMNALALMIFMRELSVNSNSYTNLNTAMEKAIEVSEKFLTPKIIGNNYTLTGKTENAEQLIGQYSSNPYLYEIGMMMAEYGAIGGATDRDSAANIASEILSFVGGKGNVSIPDSFSLGDKMTNSILNSSILGGHEDLIDLKDSDEKKASMDLLYKINNDNINAVVGSDITIGSSSTSITVDVGPNLTKASIFEADKNAKDNDKKIFGFAAAKDLTLAGDIRFKNENHAEDHALFLGAADDVHLEKQTKIFNEGTNLGIGSYDSLVLHEIDIDTGGNLAIGTLESLDIKSSSFSVGRYSDRDNIYLYADQLLSVDNLAFSGNVREIYMEATTIDLKNTTFPNDSEVMLRSQKGNINFGSSKPHAVNFINNVYYGSTAITSPTQFTPKTNTKGEYGQNSTFTTSMGVPGIKIRAFPSN